MPIAKFYLCPETKKGRFPHYACAMCSFQPLMPKETSKKLLEVEKSNSWGHNILMLRDQ